MMRKLAVVGLAALLLLVASPATGQVVFQRTSGSITAAGATCTSTTCVTIADMSRTANGSIVVTGTWVATLQFEGLLDSTGGWFALNVLPAGSSTYVTSATANGQWIIPMALVGVRVRASAYTSGTASVGIVVTSARSPSSPGPALPVSIANGGTNATSFTTTNGIIKYNGTRLVTGLMTDDGTDVGWNSGTMLGPAGTAARPTYSLAAQSTMGWWRKSANIMVLTSNGAETGGIGVAPTGALLVAAGTLTWSSDSAIDSAADVGWARKAPGVVGPNDGSSGHGAIAVGAALTFSSTAPTVSGFGTSPSVSGTATAFTINVGTGGTASTGTVTLPTATTGWKVQCTDVTNNASFVTDQTGGTATTATLQNYSRTTGLGIAWTASDILRCTGTAY